MIPGMSLHKMELKMKLSRKFSRFERQKIGIAVLAGCFLASMTFVALPKPPDVSPPTLSFALYLRAAQTSPMGEDNHIPQKSEDIRSDNSTQQSKPSCDDGDPRSSLCEKNDTLTNVNSSTSLDSSGGEDAKTTLQIEDIRSKNSTQKMKPTCDNGDPRSSLCQKNDIAPMNVNSSASLDSSGGQDTKTTLQIGSSAHENKGLERNPLCNVSDPRSDLCEMDGDIRIHGNSSSVTFVVANSETGDSKGNNSWRIRPYARKGDGIAFNHVREVFVRSKEESPQCTHNHSIPAIVFSVGGYTGNLFHDFTDVLIPLFLTANQFNGEVQFLLSDMNIWWVQKYHLVLQKLSHYPIIDFDKDDAVHCFPQAIVGLRCHKELSIDPSRSPKGYSMVDFTRFMRRAYSLERDTPMVINEQLDKNAKKPRLLIISRKRTRAFLNVDDIIHMAEELGYEVVATEPEISSDIVGMAHIVNSCDVMVGVHGAGLTNLVFLPTNATIIQIVPWGGLEWISMLDFGNPAKDMSLKYIQYSIKAEESSLIEKYPRDHEVFKNPFSFHNKGWNILRETFMDTQNVRLDVKRFRSVLLKVLEQLH